MPSVTEVGILGLVIVILLKDTIPKLLNKSGSNGHVVGQVERNKKDIEKINDRIDGIRDSLTRIDVTLAEINAKLKP